MRYEIVTKEELKTVDVRTLKDAIPGAYFHGEEWVECPHCGSAVEMVGSGAPLKDHYYIVKCKCGKLFRDAAGF